MPDDAADEALAAVRHSYGRVMPGWCERCGEHVCCCLSARPLDDPPPLTVPCLAPAEPDLRVRRICY